MNSLKGRPNLGPQEIKIMKKTNVSLKLNKVTVANLGNKSMSNIVGGNNFSKMPKHCITQPENCYNPDYVTNLMLCRYEQTAPFVCG